MTKAYQEKLIELAEELRIFTAKFFELGEGRKNVTREYSEQDIALLSKINYLVGYIFGLKEIEKL